MRPSCSAARTGADPVPYSFASSRSLVTTSGVKRVFSSVAAPACFGRRQSSLNKRGGGKNRAGWRGAEGTRPPAPQEKEAKGCKSLGPHLTTPPGREKQK